RTGHQTLHVARGVHDSCCAEARGAAAINAVNRAVLRVGNIDFACLILAKRRDAEAGREQPPIAPLASLALYSPDGAAAIITVNIGASQSRRKASAIHEATRNRAAIRARVFGNRKHQALCAASILEAVRSFHPIPSVILAAPARRRLVVYFFKRVLADIGDPQSTCGAIEAEAPRIAQAEGPDFRTRASGIHKWIVGRNADVSGIAFHIDPQHFSE